MLVDRLLVIFVRTGNVHVIYAIVRRKELFERIASLTLPTAIKVSPLA